MTYGSDNLVELKAVANAPLSDTVAGRLAVSQRWRDGHISNVTLGDSTGGEDLLTVRGQLLFEPNDDLRFRLSADWLRDRGDGLVQSYLTTFQPSLIAPIALPTDLRATAQGLNGSTERDAVAVTARADWTAAIGTLTSITGYRAVDSDLPGTSTGSPINTVLTRVVMDDKLLSQEFRLASPDDQLVSWVVGAYFLKLDRQRDERIRFDLAPGSLLSFVAPGPGVYAALQSQDIELESTALFGERPKD